MTPASRCPPPTRWPGSCARWACRGQDIPAEEDERAARYRSLLAGRRMLVVLDNAAIGGAGPAAAARHRRLRGGGDQPRLAGRAGRPGRRRAAGPGPAAAGRGGRPAAGADRRRGSTPTRARPRTLAGQCCRLPLALRVAAELAAARPAVRLAELAGELADQQRRLDLLDAGGDPRTAVRAVFSWSYRHLDADAARAFRLARPAPRPRLRPLRRRRAHRHHRRRRPGRCWTRWPART